MVSVEFLEQLFVCLLLLPTWVLFLDTILNDVVFTAKAVTIYLSSSVVACIIGGVYSRYCHTCFVKHELIFVIVPCAILSAIPIVDSNKLEYINVTCLLFSFLIFSVWRARILNKNGK